MATAVGQAAPPHPDGWRLVGLFEGVEYRVLIHSSPQGPRYSVHALDGRLLAPDLYADEVYREFPTLDVQTLRLDPAERESGGWSALMLADDPG